MRIFVTGATGGIGNFVVPELLEANHQVLGLCRSEEKAAGLRKLGAEALIGNISDLDVLKKGALSCDAVIHLAFLHDFTDFMGACAMDRAAIETMCSVMEGTEKPFVMTSGTMMLKHGQVATEADTPDMTSMFGASRGPSEGLALAFAQKGVRPVVVRLSPTVHNTGDPGFTYMLASTAREKGEASYVGDGQKRWAAVHKADAAALFRLAVEKALPGGIVLHGVADEGVTQKEIAEAIGKRYNVPVTTKSDEEAQAHFGMVSMFVIVDNPASSVKTREIMGWAPTNSSLIQDIENGAYDEPASK